MYLLFYTEIRVIILYAQVRVFNCKHSRHFLSTAKQVGFNESTARKLFVEMMDRVDEVVEQVTTQIPAGFPANIVDSMMSGMRKQRDNKSPR